MFGFSLSGNNGNRKEMNTGVQLLASMLVCYPELYAVTYDPHETEITLDFVVQARVSHEKMKEFADLVDKSVQTYHDLYGGEPVWLAIDADVNGKLMTVHVRRQFATMLRGELDLLTELFRDRFGEGLQTDAHTLDALEPEFSTMQSNLLDQMFELAQNSRIKERMIGMREKDKVVVYNR